jgi:hypothetical protein
VVSNGNMCVVTTFYFYNLALMIRIVLCLRDLRFLNWSYEEFYLMDIMTCSPLKAKQRSPTHLKILVYLTYILKCFIFVTTVWILTEVT